MTPRFVIVITFLVIAISCASDANAAKPVSLRWDCARAGAPSLRQSAAIYGYDTYNLVVPARNALYREIRHACKQGIGRVVVEQVAAPRAEFRAASR
jgi:hypothetical protein